MPLAQAHLMVAQRGTLNLVADGGFMVLSLPVSAFEGVDDDGDGQLSAAELQAHAGAIEQQVQRGVHLLAPGTRSSEPTSLPLQGLLVQLSHSETPGSSASRQVIVMGRFALGSHTTGLQLRVGLFGRHADEQTQQITVSRGSVAQRLVLTPQQPMGSVLPGAGTVFVDHLQQGMTHVLSGFDHLLFLLVVLASGWRLRPALLALSCFTLGHALTLAASAYGVLTVPSRIVEPAIAASIVAMALFDRWMQRSEKSGGRAWPQAARLALIFAFALVHGLGLAGALSDLGLDPANRLWSLAGFNVGVELAQVGVALLTAALMSSLAYVRGPAAQGLAHRLASHVALAAGSVWFLQRVSGLA